MKQSKIFKMMEDHDYEQLVFFQDKKTGLKGITGIHDTRRGPALGGLRLWDYETEDDAIVDALRLARGMSYKSACAGLNLGGGKTVLIGTKDLKSKEYLEMVGNYVESLNGRYITAEDININCDDCEIIATKTKHVSGLKGKGGSGNPSPITAWGVFMSLKASLEETFGSDKLAGRKISVQGAGQTGYFLIKYLLGYTVQDILQDKGPSSDDKVEKIYFTEINQEHIDRLAKEHPEVEYVKPDTIYGLDVDVFAPCALGGVINPDTIKQLKCKIVCGSSNNVLKDITDGQALKDKGILYAPDYVANGGGVINVYYELLGNYDQAKAIEKVEEIRGTITEIFKIAKEQNITTAQAADNLGDTRMQEAEKERNTSPRKMLIPSKK